MHQALFAVMALFGAIGTIWNDIQGNTWRSLACLLMTILMILLAVAPLRKVDDPAGIEDE